MVFWHWWSVWLLPLTGEKEFGGGPLASGRRNQSALMESRLSAKYRRCD